MRAYAAGRKVEVPMPGGGRGGRARFSGALQKLGSVVMLRDRPLKEDNASLGAEEAERRAREVAQRMLTTPKKPVTSSPKKAKPKKKSGRSQSAVPR